MADDILDVRVLLVAVLAAQVVDPREAVEGEVHDGDEDEDADGVGPHDDDGDDVGPAVVRVVERGLGRGLHDAAAAAGQPAEEREDGGERVDAEDGEDELPRRPGLAPARHEDEPVLGQRDLEEQHLLDGAEVLHHAAAAQEHGAPHDPRARRQKEPQDHADDPDLLELPLHRPRLHVRVVVGDGDRGQVGEQRDEHDQVWPDRLVDDHHGRGEVDLQVQTQRDTVLHVGFHTLEDLYEVSIMGVARI